MSGTTQTPPNFGPIDQRQASAITGSAANAQVLQGQINSLNATYGALSSTVGTLQAQQGQIPPTLAANITTLNAATAATNVTLTTIQTSITSLSTQMTAVQLAATSLANRVSVLETASPPPAVPNAPTALTVTSTTSTTIGYSWTAPVSGPAVTSYQLQAALAGTGAWVNQTSGAGTTGTASGLTALTAYDARVIASDAAGPGGILVSSAPQTTLAAAGGVTWKTTSTIGATNFAEEFGSNDINDNGSSSTWMNHYPFGGSEFTLAFNNEAEFYASATRTPTFSPFGVAAGVLTITADTVANTVSNPPGLPYNSGVIVSATESNGTPAPGLFSQTYGYFEAKMQLPKGRGLWPAFWLLPLTGPGEIDIMEQLGQDNTTIFCSLHATTGAGSTTVSLGFDASLAMHTYGANWQPDFITWFVDGKQVAQLPTPSDMVGKPYYILSDFAVGALNSFPGPPDGSTSFPATMKLDYIRVFPSSTVAGIGSPTVTFSNSNLTATAAGGTSTPYSLCQDAISTTSKSTGKWCFEMAMTHLTQNTSIGLLNQKHLLGLPGGFGADVNSTGYYMSTGVGSQAAQTIAWNNTNTLNPPSPGPTADSAGAVLTFCVDVDGGQWWVTSPAMRAFVGPFAWNNNATAVPGVSGGVPIGVVGPLFIGFDTSESGAVVIANFGSSTFSFSPPAQFLPWDGTVVSLVIPGTPTGLAAGTPLATSVPLTWSDSGTGTPPFTDQIQSSPHGANTWTGMDVADVGNTNPFSPDFNPAFGSGLITGTATGLSPSTSYDFRVRSTNQAGNSAYDTLSTGITTASAPSVPGAPSAVTANTAITSSGFTAKWTDPVTGGAATGFQVQTRAGNTGAFVNFATKAAANATSQVITGLAPNTLYGVDVLAFNATGNSLASNIATVTTLAGIGQPANPNVSVNLTSLVAGKPPVSKYLYGFATGFDAHDGFSQFLGPTADPGWQASMAKLRPTLIRINANEGFIQLWNNNNSLINNFKNTFSQWADPQCRVVLGCGPTSAGDTGTSPTAMGTLVANFASAMRAAGFPITYYEMGNELQGMDINTFNSYFNAIATALKGVGAEMKLGGTVADWWGDISISQWIAACAPNIGFGDFHSYTGGPDVAANRYGNALGFTDVSLFRQAIAGSVAANVEIGLLEFNQDGAPGVSQLQQNIVGAIYVALVLATAFNSDSNFTMGGMWDLLIDGNYGAIGGNGSSSTTINPTGWYLGTAGQIMAGNQCSATTSLSNLHVFATNTASIGTVQLTNYGTTNLTVNLGLTGKSLGNSLTRIELSNAALQTSRTTISSLANISIPAQSIVWITG